VDTIVKMANKDTNRLRQTAGLPLTSGYGALGVAGDVLNWSPIESNVGDDRGVEIFFLTASVVPGVVLPTGKCVRRLAGQVGTELAWLRLTE
jgi:hypothetical protein